MSNIAILRRPDVSLQFHCSLRVEVGKRFAASRGGAPLSGLTLTSSMRAARESGNWCTHDVLVIDSLKTLSRFLRQTLVFELCQSASP